MSCIVTVTAASSVRRVPRSLRSVARAPLYAAASPWYWAAVSAWLR